MAGRKPRKVREGLKKPRKNLEKQFRSVTKSVSDTFDDFLNTVESGFNSAASIVKPGKGKRTLRQKMARRRKLAKKARTGA